MGIKKLKKENEHLNLSLIDIFSAYDKSKTKKYTQLVNENWEMRTGPLFFSVTEIFKDLNNLKRSDTFLNYPDHDSFDNVIKAVVPAYYRNWSYTQLFVGDKI